ncbi:glycosyltransferase [Flavobacteriaceae bacterium LMO-SS05]
MQKTCVIIPCYNEKERFPFDDFLKGLKAAEKMDFCFVNDGSTDGTLTVLNQLKSSASNMIVLDRPENKGKAEAIRYAVLHLDTTPYDYIGYLDADLSTSLPEMQRLSSFKAQDLTFIMGSRIKKLGSVIKRDRFRHIFGRILATVVSACILRIPVYDTQCGAKLIATPLAVDIFREPFVSRWLFDIELLLRVMELKGKSYCDHAVVEIPLLNWHDKGDSRIKIIDFIKIPIDLLKIHNTYKGLHV